MRSTVNYVRILYSQIIHVISKCVHVARLGLTEELRGVV